MTTEAERIVALARVNRSARLADLVRNASVILLLVVVVTFNALIFMNVRAENAQINRRAVENHLSLEILQRATGPEQVKASARTLACFVNRMDFDTGHGQLDPTCPTYGP